ncbi:hypothetical protein RN001_016098 [Aquatica leii]|uniref:Reverse transcriptase domain-containing protein n=1 Tax=Aquatica leii TaxID=1421715 RepID=A0AAN7NXJ6_9COLE|nr:hypothetical protein RN001_016098 [Aquatica leii]
MLTSSAENKNTFPTPFKNAFYWPESTVKTKNDKTEGTNKKSKIYPTVATSDEFIEHQRRVKKETEKKDTEKRERIRIRKEKNKLVKRTSKVVNKKPDINRNKHITEANNKDPVLLFSLIPIKRENIFSQKKVVENISGAAMGSPLSPVVANIFMESFETVPLESSILKPKVWFRYVDDTFIVCIMNQQMLIQRPPTPAEFELSQQNQILVQQNQLKTQNEINLWNAWQQSLATIETLKGNINLLMQRVNSLEKPVTVPNVEQGIENKTEYHTNEEKLARETEWIVQRSKKNKSKKRKASGTPETPPQASTSNQTTTWLKKRKYPYRRR